MQSRRIIVVSGKSSRLLGLKIKSMFQADQNFGWRFCIFLEKPEVSVGDSKEIHEKIDSDF
jgi:hypothetical protein